MRHDTECFCISPGSRSTPLTSAVAANPKANAVVCYDERAAAYYALGHARATGLPAVLICTSGTAAATYLPAVIEASVEQIPLLLMTADRPPELRTPARIRLLTRPIFSVRMSAGILIQAAQDRNSLQKLYLPQLTMQYLKHIFLCPVQYI